MMHTRSQNTMIHSGAIYLMVIIGSMFTVSEERIRKHEGLVRNSLSYSSCDQYMLDIWMLLPIQETVNPLYCILISSLKRATNNDVTVADSLPTSVQRYIVSCHVIMWHKLH